MEARKQTAREVPSPLPAPSPTLLPPARDQPPPPTIPALLPGAPGRTNTPSRPPGHRLIPTARRWRSPRQLGVTRTSTPETRRPALPPRPLGPGQAQQALPSRCAAAPPGLRRLPTRPRCVAHLSRSPQPWEKAAGKSLVYWVGVILGWIRFPISAVPLLLIPGTGEERGATR